MLDAGVIPFMLVLGRGCKIATLPVLTAPADDPPVVAAR